MRLSIFIPTVLLLLVVNCVLVSSQLYEGKQETNESEELNVPVIDQENNGGIPDPVISDPAGQGQVINDPAIQDQAVNDPAVQDQAISDPAVQDQAISDPAVQDQAINDPAAQDQLGDKPLEEKPDNKPNILISRRSPKANLAPEKPIEKAPVQAISENQVLNNDQPPQQVLGNPPKDSQNTAIHWTLATSKECSADANRVCSQKTALHDLEVLACLSNAVETVFISDECQHLMWEFKKNLTTHKKFDEKVFEYCGDIMRSKGYDCQKYEIGSGKIIPCMLNHLDDNVMRNTICSRYLSQFANIIFADYRLICDFVEDCEADIKRGKCGKLQGGNFRDMKPSLYHSQGKVIACLEERLTYDNGSVSHACAKQIFRLSELQADDYHTDRHLYLSCKDVREELCEKVIAGNGAVYECLFKHKFDPLMTEQCRNAITIRQKLISQDYRINFQVHQFCYHEIGKHNCMSEIPKGVNDQSDNVGLSTILLCLENVKLRGERIETQCDSALNNFRKQLLLDYKISPEILHSCSQLIESKCQNGVEREGATLHCLMNNIHLEPDLHPKCGNALMELVKETDVENNFQLDISLAKSCFPVIESSCNKFEPTDVALLSCLLERLHTSDMNEECEQKLIDIQYFLGRDFFIDKQFNTMCREDVSNFCHTDVGDYDSNTKEGISPMPMELVLSCLHRYMSQYSEDDMTLSTGCEDQVMKILKTRALDYQLNPVLDAACRSELGKYCSENPPKKGEELQCLQTNYEKIQYGSPCQKEIQRLTGWQSENVEDLESVLVKECEKMLNEFCGDLLHQKNDEETVMECLIRNKANMDSKKCVAGIEYFQLIEMKDYKFDAKFVKQCRSDVERLCNDKNVIKTKADVIQCLSKNIRDAVLKDQDVLVSKECRDQLTVEKLETHENILLNPQLKKSCALDVRDFCGDIKTGEARVIGCLRHHKPQLSKPCRVQLFKFQKDEVGQVKLDFQLMRACKRDLKAKCIDKLRRNDRRLMMECLVTHKSELEKNCRKMVIYREIEMFDDINLNPDLMDNCKVELAHHCEKELEKLRSEESDGEDPEGIVYNCLKKSFANDDDMSEGCRRHVLFVIQEQEENYALDPRLTLYCINPIQTFCQDQNEVECLKTAYFNDKLKLFPLCMKEVAMILMQGRSDINADPVLLEKCGADVSRLCRNVQEGGGKKIKCLIEYDTNEPDLLDPECREELSMRKQMWNAVTRNEPEGFGDIAELVRKSKNADYLIAGSAAAILMVLLLGCMFGRATKRNHYRQLKNR